MRKELVFPALHIVQRKDSHIRNPSKASVTPSIHLSVHPLNTPSRKKGKQKNTAFSIISPLAIMKGGIKYGTTEVK